MCKVDKIIQKLEKFALPELAAAWDNSGWQVYLGIQKVEKLLLTLSATPEAVKYAASKGCEMIFSHHPMVFEKINKFSVENNQSLALIQAIQYGLQVYSAHTNLDACNGGIADSLSNILGLKNTSIFQFGRIGELSEETGIFEFADYVKKTLNTPFVRLINPLNIQKIKTVAVIPGSGGDLIYKINDMEKIDLLVTGDVKYHQALEVRETAVIDAGHLETERIILPVLQKLLLDLDVETIIYEENSPWKIL